MSMNCLKNLSVSLLFIFLYATSTQAITLDVQNRCPHTVWAAAFPGGGKRLDPSRKWVTEVNSGGNPVLIWARTKCTFDGAGKGRCETGNCNGLLRCSAAGSPPLTVAEFLENQYNDMNFFDVSLLNGFNVPMEISPKSNGCSKRIKCAADINGPCPKELKAPGYMCCLQNQATL